jgi:hypothetical protein
MKKLTYILVALVMAGALASCEQGNDEIVLKKGDSLTEAVTAPSEEGVAPVVITGANNGGNVTCAEVAAAFGLPAGYFYCGEKIDYNDGTFDGEFPEGLLVEVKEGKYVSFSLESPLVIEGRSYVIGAAIVKGGNKANVYYYPGGSMSDSGLSAPVNASGKPAGLSNLTFCLMEKLPELVIGLKTYLATPVPGEVITYNRKTSWAVSDGLGYETNSLFMGYSVYNYGVDNNIDLILSLLTGRIGKIGVITAKDFWEEGVHYLEVTVNLDSKANVIDDTYLYVGSLEGYEGMYFNSFPFQALNNLVEQRVFKIPFSEIVL